MLVPAWLKFPSNMAVARRAPGFPYFNKLFRRAWRRVAKSTCSRGTDLSL